MLFKRFLISTIFMSLLVAGFSAQAAPFTFNVDGVISDSSGTAIEAASVSFTISVRNPTETCTLYSESFSVNMVGSKGYFSLVLGKGTNLVSGGVSLEKVFSNQGTVIPGATSCTYTPSTTAATRMIVVAFDDGSGNGVQTFSSQEVQSVPFALESVQSSKVGIFGPTDLLRVDSAVTQTTNTNSALTQAQYDEFWRVVKSPLTAYLPTTGDVVNVSGSNKVTTLLGQALPGATAASGQALVSNGTSWALQTIGAGAVTSVGVTAPITNSGTATAPVITIPAATTSVSGYLTSTDWNTFNGKQSSTLASGLIWIGSASNIATGLPVSGDAVLSSTGALTLANTITAGSGIGGASAIPVITYDSKGRLTTVSTIAPIDTSKVPLAGGTMTGDLLMSGGAKITGMTNVPNVAANPNGTQDGQSLRWNNTTSVWDWYTPAGGGITSFGGQTGTSQSFGAVDTVSAVTAPQWSSSSNVHTLKIPMSSATGVTAGLLSKTDYDRIWTKVDSSYATKGVVQFDTSAAISGVTVASGVANINRTTTATASTILSLDGSGVANMTGAGLIGSGGVVTLQTATPSSGTYGIRLPANQGSANQTLVNDGIGNLLWASILPASAGTAAAPGYAFSGNTTTGMFGPATNQLGFSTSGVERVHIDASGNVGIGTTGPETKLDVNGSVTMRQAYYESVGVLGTLSCGATNISGFTTNIYELTACASGSTTLNIPTVTAWPSGNMSWNVTFYVTGQTASVFNVTYNSATTSVYWDRNSTGTVGGNNFTGFNVNSGTTNVISCTVVNTSSVKVYCGVAAQY